MSELPDSGLTLDDELRGPHLPAHIYIHVPFCRMKCSYCDFYSVDDISSSRVELVATGIEGELGQWASSGLSGVVETLYLGGGTPTVIAGSAVRLLRSALENFPVRAGAEVTVEANPDSTSPELVEALAAAGMTRMSVGVQSFNPTELALLGRVHTVDEALAACKAARSAGVGLSLDLMCGIPGQTTSSWVASLEQALRLDPDHMSVYPLTLEEGTPLGVAVDAGLVQEPDPDVAAEMMIVAEELLGAAGLPRYEIANYARPGNESRHNLAYWTARPYLGIGPGAHSMLDPETARAVGLVPAPGADSARIPASATDVGRVRFGNPADIDSWLLGTRGEIEILTAEESRREDVMLALRLRRGVGHAAVLEAELGEVLDSLEADDLVERITGSGLPVLEDGVVPSMRWRVTRRGWLLGNEVFGRVWTGR